MTLARRLLAKAFGVAHRFDGGVVCGGRVLNRETPVGMRELRERVGNRDVGALLKGDERNSTASSGRIFKEQRLRGA